MIENTQIHPFKTRRGRVPHQTVADATSALTYTATGGAIAASTLGTNEIIAIAGLILASLTFAANLYYRHKMYNLAKAAAEATGQHVGKRIEDIIDHNNRS